jgi:hypothetical protein
MTNDLERAQDMLGCVHPTEARINPPWIGCPASVTAGIDFRNSPLGDPAYIQCCR